MRKVRWVCNSLLTTHCSLITTHYSLVGDFIITSTFLFRHQNNISSQQRTVTTKKGKNGVYPNQTVHWTQRKMNRAISTFHFRASGNKLHMRGCCIWRMERKLHQKKTDTFLTTGLHTCQTFFYDSTLENVKRSEIQGSKYTTLRNK